MTREKLTKLFNASVSCCVATPEMYQETLWPEEINCIAGAVEKRRREFAAGRTAARRALKEFGIPPRPILMNSDRSPNWPPGFVGSISHCDNCCVAVVGDARDVRGLGLDVELTEPLPDEIRPVICDQEEIAEFAKNPPPENCNWEKLAFCAKEAFYKCYYPLTKTFLDFLDVSVHFTRSDQEETGEFFIHLKKSDHPGLPLGSHLAGRWLIADGVIYTGVTLT